MFCFVHERKMASKKSYTVSFKLKVIERAEKEGKKGTAKHFGVDRRRVQEWVRQKDGLLSLKEKGKNAQKKVKRRGSQVYKHRH